MSCYPNRPREDLAHTTLLTASLVGHLHSVVIKGSPVSADEGCYAAWADLGPFSGGPVWHEDGAAGGGVTECKSGADDDPAVPTALAQCVVYQEGVPSLTPHGVELTRCVLALAYQTAPLKRRFLSQPASSDALDVRASYCWSCCRAWFSCCRWRFVEHGDRSSPPLWPCWCRDCSLYWRCTI